MGPAGQKIFEVFRCIFVKILERSLAARAKMTIHTTDIVISLTDEKSENPAKMTHSISDFWRRLRG